MTRTTSDTLRLPASLVAAPPANARELKIPPAPEAVYRAHQVPPATTSSVLPCLERGTLFLVGGGAGQADLYARFRALAGGPTAKVLDLPDATMALQGQTEPPATSPLARLLGMDGVEVLHAASRAAADSETFTAPIRAARGLWIDGGDSEAVIERYMGTRTEQEILALLDRGGVVGGTSAGALVWGSCAMMFREGVEQNPYAGMKAEDLRPGDPHEPVFGVLRNVTIVPHFAEFQLAAATRRMVETHPGLLGIGIDEATAFEVHGHVGTVLGRGHVTIFDGRDHGGQPFVVLSDGARYDLVKRATL